MKRQQEFAKKRQYQQPYHPQQQQDRGCGRNTQQQQPQFGGNMSQHHQGWLWQTGAEKVEQLNVKQLCDTRPILTTNNNNNFYSNIYNNDKYDYDKTIFHGNCTDDVTARTDPLSDNYSIESINSTNQEPKRPMELPTHNTARQQIIDTHRLQESAHADTTFNTSKIKFLSTKPSQMQD